MKKKVNGFRGSILWRLRVFGAKNIKFPKTIGEEISTQNANALRSGHGGDEGSSLRRNILNLSSSHWRNNKWIFFAHCESEGMKRKIVSPDKKKGMWLKSPFLRRTKESIFR